MIAECKNLIQNNDIKLTDLETYILSEGLMVMKVNSETITTVFLCFFQSVSRIIIFILV